MLKNHHAKILVEATFHNVQIPQCARRSFQRRNILLQQFQELTQLFRMRLLISEHQIVRERP